MKILIIIRTKKKPKTNRLQLISITLLHHPPCVDTQRIPSRSFRTGPVQFRNANLRLIHDQVRHVHWHQSSPIRAISCDQPAIMWRQQFVLVVFFLLIGVRDASMIYNVTGRAIHYSILFCSCSLFAPFTGASVIHWGLALVSLFLDSFPPPTLVATVVHARLLYKLHFMLHGCAAPDRKARQPDQSVCLNVCLICQDVSSLLFLLLAGPHLSFPTLHLQSPFSVFRFQIPRPS